MERWIVHLGREGLETWRLSCCSVVSGSSAGEEQARVSEPIAKILLIKVLLDLSAISPVDVPQPWHISAFFQAEIALIYLMTKANHVIAQICHFTSFGRFLW